MPNTWARYAGEDPWLTGEIPNTTEFNNLGRSIREIGWSKTPGTVTINYNQNHITALGNIYFHSNGKVMTPFLVTPSTSFHKVNGLTLPNDTPVALETVINGSNGILQITAHDGLCAGIVHIRAGYNNANILSNSGGNLSSTDTAGKLCIIPDLDSTYSIRNRMGYPLFLSVLFSGY